MAASVTSTTIKSLPWPPRSDINCRSVWPGALNFLPQMHSGIKTDLWTGHRSLPPTMECVRGRKQLWLLPTWTHTQTPGNLVLQAGQAQPWHERMGVKTDSKQNGCIPNESNQLIIYAYWEFLRTEKLQAPSGGLGTGRGQQVYLL